MSLDREFECGKITSQSPVTVLSCVKGHYATIMAFRNVYTLNDIVVRCSMKDLAQVRAEIDQLALNKRAGVTTSKGYVVPRVNKRVCEEIIKLLVYAQNHPDKFTNIKIIPKQVDLQMLCVKK